GAFIWNLGLWRPQLARHVRRSADRGRLPGLAVSVDRLGPPHALDILAKLAARLLPRNRRKEQREGCADDRSEHETQHESTDQLAIGVSAYDVPDLTLAVAEELRCALARLILEVVHNVLQVFHVDHTVLLPPLGLTPLDRCRADASFPARLSWAREGRLDEGVNVAVEHPFGVTDFDPRAQILHLRVGMEHVRSDLAAPVRRAKLATFLGLGLLLLADLTLEESRAQDLERRLLVL